MAKFDFNTSTYNLLSDPVEGRNIMTQILNDPDLIDVQQPYFPTAFSISNEPIMTDGRGNASFTVNAKYPEHAEMMDMRAPLTNGRPAEEGEQESYSGSIADFIAPVYNEKAPERLYKERLFEKYGNDAALIQGYAQDVLKPRIQAGYMALDYMAVLAETSGKVKYDKGAGIKGTLYKADIPAENFVNAGAKVWTDPTAPILDYMAAIEEKFITLWGADFPRQWKMDVDYFKSVLLQNKQVQDYIKIGWLTQQGQLISQMDSVPASIITEENFNKYVIGSYPGLSPIKLVKVRVRDRQTVINPWPDGIVTLSPAGYAGEIYRTDILDEEVYSRFGNNACSFNFARTADDLMLVMHSVVPDGSLKAWETKVLMSAVPVITDWLYRVVVSTKVAD